MSQLEKVYGVHAVEALLRHHPKRVKQLWLAESRQAPRVQALLELAAQNRVAVGHRYAPPKPAPTRAHAACPNAAACA